MAAWLGRAVISDGQLVGDQAALGAPGLQPPAIAISIYRGQQQIILVFTQDLQIHASTSHLFMNTMSEPRDVTL